MSNILLITNTKDIIDAFADKLALLRNGDQISYCDYEDAPDIVFANHPDIVILHEHDNFEKTLGLIKYIKTKNCSILLMVNKYSRNNVLDAYDEGIDDYFYANSDPSEILIRIVNCIKKQNCDFKISEYRNFLQKYGVISENTGFYSKKCAQEVCAEEFLLKDYSNGALTFIYFDTAGNSDLAEIVSAIKNSVRFNDFVVNAGHFKFYIINKDFGAKGALAIINKIKHANIPCSINAGICEIKKYTFNQAEKKAQCALSDAMLSGRETVIYAKQDTGMDDDWLDIPSSSQKNYKIFKQVYLKKLEKVITPVFYRTQKDCENRFKNVKIEQYTDELQCIFRLSQGNHSSVLKIIYTGMTKIKIMINHAGLYSPENSEISIHVNKINTTQLSEIIERFIGEFKTTI